MRTSLAASFLFTLGLLTSTGVSLCLAQDSDGSGLDLESYDSGDGSEDDATDDIALEDSRHGDVFHPTPSVINPPADESEWIFMGNSKSFLENPDIRTGVISGGVTGVILAVVITALLIYKWQKKETERFILSNRKDSDKYHLNRRKGDFIV